MYGATLTAATINGDCAVTPAYDVWYKFTAQTTNPTINLSNIGVNFTNPAMELLSNNCGGTFTAIHVRYYFDCRKLFNSRYDVLHQGLFIFGTAPTSSSYWTVLIFVSLTR